MKAATIDGRPIAWQTIDWSRHHAVVLRKYVASGGGYDTIEVADPGFSYAWNALNSQGLANVGNGLRDLAPANWTTDIIPTIQRQCATVGDVRSYLSTIGGQYQVGVNIAVIDATGRVLDFEIGPSRFWEYDPENAQRQTQSFFQPPKLFVNRANRSFRNDQQQEIDAVVDTWDADDSKRRYRTARDLFVKYITNGDKLTIGEAANITRWGDPGHGKRSISGPHTIWGNIFLGVKAGEDPKYATMLVAMGYPDYSIYLPVWVDLSQAELSQRVKTWDAKNLAWWSFKLFDERFDNTEDYDNYINGIFKAVEDNIIDAVKMARDNWLVAGNSARFHDEAVVLHSWSASAAYYTIRSAYETAGSNGRSCNRPPEIASLNPVRNGLSVSLRCDATDPDGDGIAKYYWHFGDGTTSGATQQATQSHTYAVDGTYLVVCYAVDGRSSPAVNLKFAYVTVAGKHGGDARPDAGAIDGATDGAADGSPHAHDGGARALDGSTDAQTDGPPTTDTLPNDARADTGARVGDAAGGGDAGIDRGRDTLGGGCATSGRGGQRAPDLVWLLLLVVLACPSARRPHSQRTGQPRARRGDRAACSKEWSTMCTVARTSVALAALIVCACGVENPEHRLQTDAAVTDAAVTDAPATTVDGGSTATDGALARDAETESDAEVDGAISCNSAFPSYEDLEVGQSTSYTTCDGKSHTITLESQSLDTLTLTVDGFSLAFDLAKSRCGSPGRQLPKDFHGVKVLPEVTSDIEKVAACDPGDGKYRRWKHLRVAWETGDEAADKDIEDPGSARLRLSDPDGSLPFGLFPITSVKTCSQLLDAASNLFLDPVSYGFHAGIDFPLPVGTPLVAVRPGKVVKVDRSCVKNPSVDCHACGNYVVIEDETYNTWYCHMHKVVEGLTTGQTVAAGQYLGESGASNTKGLDGGSPHLHFHLAENARSDLDDESVFSVNAYPFLDAWCNEHTARPEPSPDNAHRIRSFRLSTVADAGGKETGEAYCTAKGLKCLSVDRLWHNGDEKWLPFESDQGDWYAKSCTKKMLTEASSDGMAKVVNCYGANAAGSADELLLFGLHDPLSARSKRTATAYCSARGLGSAGADWLYAEQGSAPRCWYGGSPKKWWCPFGTSSTLRSHWKSSNDSLAHDSGLARQVYCVGREQDTTDKTHAIHRYYLDKASQAGVKSASELCWKWGMTCLGVEWLHREGCAKDGWCTRDELGSEVDWAQWKHFGCSEAISNATYDGLARVVSCRSYRSE